eukprot:c22732_g2_i1 orf=1464-2561(+)
MAVQAQYPSNIILPSFRNRIHQSGTTENRNVISAISPATGTLEYVQLPPTTESLLRAYNSGFNFGQQLSPNAGTSLNIPENELAYYLASSRKRPREVEDMLTRQHNFVSFVDIQQGNAAPAFLIPQATGANSTGLRVTLEDNQLNNPSATLTSITGNAAPFPFILQEELQSEMMKEGEEIDQLIKIQGERMKQVLEEKRQRHACSLLAAIEDAFSKRLKDKEAELEEVNRRNLELEERVKQLCLESQLWQNMAKNNEVMVSTLRSSLEQVVAQSREQSKEGCGDSEAEDAESCHYGEGGDVHARTFRENKELKEQRTCRVCRTNDVCILLLPCRHLCLCKDCENRLDTCPLCRSPKDVSVQVYLS